MDRWSSRGGKSQRRERRKKEQQRRERVRRKKRKARTKVEKSQNTVFFQCFVAPEAQKVGSLKRRAQRHLVRWASKNCIPVARSRFKVKLLKTHRFRTTFGSWGCKSARRCGAKHICKAKCQKFGFGALLAGELLKNCTRLWREAQKHLWFGALLAGELLKNCARLWREARFEVKMLKRLWVLAEIASFWSWALPFYYEDSGLLFSGRQKDRSTEREREGERERIKNKYIYIYIQHTSK